MKATIIYFLFLIVAQGLLINSAQGSPAPMAGSAQTVDCGRVAGVLGQCYSFLTGVSPEPMPSCCEGVKQISTTSGSGPNDKQAICTCIKQAISNFHNIKESAFMDLPRACHLEAAISYKDCTRFY